MWQIIIKIVTTKKILLESIVYWIVIEKIGVVFINSTIDDTLPSKYYLGVYYDNVLLLLSKLWEKE